MAIEQQLGPRKNDLKKSLAPVEQPSIHGNILDLVAKRENKMSQPSRAIGRDRANTNVNRNGTKNVQPKYFQPFVPDIDNFAGVKQV